MKVAARIQRILAGDAPVALVHACTPEGHDIKIEVPMTQLDHRTAPGDILLVEWTIFQNLLPESTDN